MNRNRVLTVLFIGVLMAALDIAIVSPALPAIQASFGVGERQLTWVFTGYVLMNLIGTPLMGKLSDAYGRRAIYIIDVALFALGSLIVMLAPAFWVVILGRLVQGLGAGGIFPVASAVIGDTFPADKRGGALGLIGAVFGLAFIVGPILGGLLLLISWHWIFAINLPIAAGLILAAWRVLPSTRPATRLPFDWIGMSVLALLLLSLAFGLNQLDANDFVGSLLSLQVWPFLVIAVALAPLFWFVEKRAQDPVILPSLLRTRQLQLASGISLGAGLGEVGVLFIPALAVAAFGVTESQSSFMLLALVFALFVGSPVAGRLLDKVGSRLVIIGGSSMLALGMVVLGFLGSNIVGFYAGSVLVGLGLSALLGAPIRYILINEAPASDRAAAQSIGTIFTSTGQLAGTAVVGAVAASFGGAAGGYTAAYLTIGGVAIVVTLLAFGLKGRAEEIATAARVAEVTSG